MGCPYCSNAMAKKYQVKCKGGCVLTCCHVCHNTPQAKIGTKCPSCGKSACWKKL